MTEVLTEQGFQLTGACDDASCLVEIGRLIGAEFIVGGSVSQVDNKYSVAISIVNVATGEVVNSNSISGFLNTDKLLGQGAVKLIDGLLQKRARRGILQSPYFWSGIAVTVAAGTYVYLQSQEEQPEVPITTGTVEVTVIFP
jgi:curli biogenesis system outer membrane secretion channel CsgG